jgi:putative phosphoesterase
MRVGLVSDTHGLLRPEVLAFLRGSDHIVHGGDVCDAAVLEALRAIAPVTAVRGNNDRGAWAAALPETATLDAGGAVLHVLHDVKLLDCDPRAAGFAAVVAGHSHKPRNEVIGGVLWFNPGAAGPRRFSLPVSVGLITCRRKKLTAELVTLDV